MTDWKSIQRRHDREDLREFAGGLLSMLAGAVVLTLPVWMILLGII